MMTSAQLDARLWCLTGRECAACELQHGPMCEPGTFEERIEALLSDRATLEAENERLRGLLREWTDMDPLRYDSEYSACPWCNFDYANMRHEPDCAFVQARTECGIAALAALEAEVGE
jgi:hypothetical protein